MKFRVSNLRLDTAALGLLLAVAALLAWAAPGYAADDATDTVVLGVTGYELFDWYTAEGYKTVTNPNAAIDAFTNDATKTRLLILKNAATPDATPVSWNFSISMTTPPGKLKTIEGGSLTKPYDVQIAGAGLHLFDFTDVGEADDPFIIRGVTITGAQIPVSAGGTSYIELDGCYIRENQSHAVVVSGNADVKLTNCVFYQNDDGVRVESGHAEIIHCTFYNNRGSGIQQLGGNFSATNTLLAFNQYGVRAADAAAATLTACDAWQNTGGSQDYSPASLQGSNFVIEPLFDPSPKWQGRLLTTPAAIVQNLAIKRGVGGTEVSTDFEGDGRGSPPYIGADELNPSDTTGFWSKCIVYTEPVGANGADVLINYSGPITDMDDSLFLVPQGVTDSDGYIPIPLQGADGVYWGVTGRIDTIREVNGKSFISDGAGRFVLRTPRGLLDIGSEFIIGQAVDGHVDILVDTIPPVVDLNSYVINMVMWSGTATSFGTQDVPFGIASGGVAPFPYPSISGFPQSDAPAVGGAVYAPYAVFPAYVDNNPLDPFEPPKYIYNIGSFSNGYNELASEQSLVFAVTARFIDPNVYAAKGLPVGDERPTAGFASHDPEVGLFADRYFTSAWATEGLPAAWLLRDSNFGVLTATPVNFSCSSDATGMVATWIAAIPVIQGFTPQRDRFHLVGDLIAMDMAGNFGDVATLDRNTIPPLQVSWLSGLNTRINFGTRMYGAWPEISWSLNDSGLNIDLANLSNPRPIYTYKIYGARSYGLANNDPVYEPLTGWSGWSTRNVLEAWEFDTNVNAVFETPITDRWLMVVVGGCDEAGNVLPWDFDTLAQDPADPLDGAITLLNGATSGRNWVRFYVPGKMTQIDTILYANLYYADVNGQNRTNLGPAPIVSYPPPNLRLFAEFNVRLLVNDPSLWSTSMMGVNFGVQAADFSMFQYLDSQGSDIVPFLLPFTDGSGVSIPLELGNPSNVATYTVTAVTAVNFETETEIRDLTPATFAFKVVPGSVDDYLRGAGGQQPVKQFEAR